MVLGDPHTLHGVLLRLRETVDSNKRDTQAGKGPLTYIKIWLVTFAKQIFLDLYFP